MGASGLPSCPWNSDRSWKGLLQMTHSVCPLRAIPTSAAWRMRLVPLSFLLLQRSPCSCRYLVHSAASPPAQPHLLYWKQWGPFRLWGNSGASFLTFGEMDSGLGLTRSPGHWLWALVHEARQPMSSWPDRWGGCQGIWQAS